MVKHLRHLPPVASVAMRLGRSNRSLDYAQLAHKTALEITALSDEQPTTFPRFLDLPRELQLQVFRLASLLDEKLSSGDASIRVDDGRLLAPRSSCCFRCTPDFAQCCCCNGAAYSPSCRCKPLLVTLSAVSRQTRLDALDFALTKFTIDGARERPLGILILLERLPALGRKCIRRLKLSFSTSDSTLHAQFIQHIATNVPLSTLSLTYKLSVTEYGDPMLTD